MDKASCLLAQRLRPRKPAAEQGHAAGLGQARPAPCAPRRFGGRWRTDLTPEPPEASGATELRSLHYSSLHTEPHVVSSALTKAHQQEYLIPPRWVWGGLRHVCRHSSPRVVPATSGWALEAEASIGGLPSWLGSDRGIKWNYENVFNAHPLHQGSPTWPTVLRIA